MLFNNNLPMKYLFTSLACLLFFTITVRSQSAFDKMTNEKMSKILRREAENVEGVLGRWQFNFRELQLYVITDDNANRMRIMTPILEEKDLNPHYS